MSRAHRTGENRVADRVTSRGRDALRAIAIIGTLIALLLTSSALGMVSKVHAADEVPKRAVIVSGPVHSLTWRFRGYAKAMADAATALGMDVTRLLYPKATPRSVKRAANGADLFVYVGHGNGWPSPFPPFQEDTKDGLGLSPQDPDKRTTSNVVYKGANWLRQNIEFAPNAVVILSHLSYASGNASSGMPIPTRSVAIQRVDNFANGFLSSGARVVWTLGWQPGADVINALYNEDATMDAVFMTRYRDGVNPFNGWIGANPGYYASQRVPGAEVHIDPDPTYGYLRGLTGDLEFTTTEWRDPGSVPPDTVPPVISNVSAAQAKATVATAGATLPVFTPNGDHISDSIEIDHTLSEGAFLDIEVARNDNVIRHETLWAQRGDGSTYWDGRRDDNNYVGEGTFTVTLTPRDRAGNVGDPASVRVKVLNALKAPVAMPPLFDPTDGDDLASTSILKAKLLKPATVTWVVKNRSGTVVRHGLDAELDPGPARFIWDGTDDDGKLLSRGVYRGRVRVTRPQGSYGHEIKVRVGPFWFKPSRWKLRRGDTVRMTIHTAEPVKGKPVVIANRKGLKRVRIRVHKVNSTTFTARYRTRRVGRPGKLKIRILSTDIGGGRQAQFYFLKLR